MASQVMVSSLVKLGLVAKLPTVESEWPDGVEAPSVGVQAWFGSIGQRPSGSEPAGKENGIALQSPSPVVEVGGPLQPPMGSCD